MEIAILLHLYQPITQSEEVFRKVYKESYGPLLRKIGRTKGFKISLDIPLSLLEQMDRYGYSEWISDVKDLVRLGKVELVGSAAYHPILPRLPKDLIEQQVILNEYGLGYYLGSHQSLEGESAIMLKNVTGFFPPELAVDEKVVSVLDSLNYRWFIADETALPDQAGDTPSIRNKYGIYRHKDHQTKVVVRNRSFSNMLSFKRDRDMSDVEQALHFAKSEGLGGASSSKEGNGSFAIVLDGEFFGHHYDKGFFVLDGLVSLARKMDIEIVTISDYVENNVGKALGDVISSSWGATDEEMASGNVYPMWDAPDNEIHKLQWEILESLIALYNRESAISGFEEYRVLPFWDGEGIKRVKNSVLRNKLAREILTQKSLNSDQFWWASKKILPTGDYLYSPEMVKSGLQIFEHLVGMYGNPNVEDAVKVKISSIHELLKKE